MENKKGSNYDKNLNILEKFASKCDEKTFIEEVVYLDGKYKHYVVDGVHVYLPHLGPREIVLANQPASLCDSSIEIQKGKPEIVLAQVDGGDGLCSLYVSKDSNNDYVAIDCHPNGSMNVNIEMASNGIDGAPVYEVEHSSEETIETVLDKAIQFYKDSPESKTILEQAQGFYAHVLSIYREEHSMTDDLDGVSEKELQAILDELIRNNEDKEQQLATIRKEQLLTRIRAEQEKGQMLDQQISDIKANMGRGV